jgi:hypothetical protein
MNNPCTWLIVVSTLSAGLLLYGCDESGNQAPNPGPKSDAANQVASTCSVAAPSCQQETECWFAENGGQITLACLPDMVNAAPDEDYPCTVKLGESECPSGLVCFAATGTAGKCTRPCATDGTRDCLTASPEQCVPYQPFVAGPVIHVCQML